MKIGIIGLGARIAALIPEFARADPKASFVAVADPGRDRAAVFKGTGSAPEWFEDAETMMARGRFDLLLIGSPNFLHLEHLRLALASDTPHIFVEKPVVISEEETLELARLMAAHDGVNRLIVGLVLRYSPLFRALRAAQKDGHIGEIMSMEAAEHIGPYHGSFFMRDWRRDSARSGGFMLEKCCHDLDLYQAVAGSRPAQVASFGGRKKFLPANRPDRAPAYLDRMSPRWGGADDAFSGRGDLVDYQTAIIRYENDATLSFHTNLNVPDEYRRFMVAGRDGMAEGDFIRNTFRVTLSDTGEQITRDDRVTDAPTSNEGHYGADRAMAQDIMAHVNGAKDRLALSCVEALEAGLTAMAIDRAMQTRSTVDLAGIWAAFDAALAGEEAA
ncbi:Gfo/Idh/MocA family protein [Paracoccus zeaxanthinifaciens]|uniref:Gfo/Idh/MocA family protein n=1 Tax=Paracoccus zeaxanthinifaciens TaxID=187400 RepID=UPI0003B3B05E|nr:Gfo/Idh/MocA family oxidoreductase [Paracoccus zeaxanthinifaciens]